MKILTSAQMREVDRLTMERGIPGLILMENAGYRVVEFLSERYGPLAGQRIAIFCGKGNNGGDGLVVARQLATRFHPAALHVVLAGDGNEFQGDAASNYQMLATAGCSTSREITPAMRTATLVIDALLGTGTHGAAKGHILDLIREINNGFPLAKIVAVDLPSGMDSDSGKSAGEFVRTDAVVTFTAPKPCHVLAPNCDQIGELRVTAIGSPPELYENDKSIALFLSEPKEFRHLLQPRPKESNKGKYGHVLAIAGARGKTGAAAMTGLAALRAGAGLVTVASAESAINAIAAHAPEIMTEPLPETQAGSISTRALDVERLEPILKGKNVVALGPGLSTHAETVRVVEQVVKHVELPMVIDADALNALAGKEIPTPAARVLTPHPGEMGRLIGKSVADVQSDRVGVARDFAKERRVTLVLKGNRTVIAFPDGRVFINPTGSPALSTGGTGDVLTGLIAGLIAQSPEDADAAVLAAVYLHGRAGELGAAELGERCLIATDLFRYLPEAIHECASVAE
ncbi:MAG TPA: NAD(P)H-hydrate dehydratase [Bryobacteraceae bacterium]|nr:NAD(P)H-hydrate dehydratase [Bryobacteraceae bacterium]